MSVELLLSEFDRFVDGPDAIELFRRAVFSLAVRGRLVPDFDEVRGERAVSEAGDCGDRHGPFVLPESWHWKRMDSIGTARLGKMLDKAKNRGTHRRYLRNINVRWFGVDLTDLKTMPFEDRELNEFALRKGDVLICEGGEPGRAAVWDGSEPDIYFQKAIHRVRLNEDVLPEFLVLYLRAAAYEGRLIGQSTGATFKHLTGKGLAALAVPVPPASVQIGIVDKVDLVMTLCDELEAELSQAKVVRMGAFEALLHDVLSGVGSRNAGVTTVGTTR